MAPSPQEQMREEAPLKPRPAPGEEVVISGLSGIFPMSDSVEEFSKNLFNKVDMVTTENPRWVFNHPEVPKHIGKVNGIGKFDAQFFRVHYKQAATMEPMSTKLLEHAYSAIYDSGMNPVQLRGKRVGVFIGATHSESEKIVIYENIQRNGFGITGCNKAMYANRISYWIDGKGPSYSLDLACASSSACIEHAYRSISSGQCDAAIVGGCNLCMHPNVCLNFSRAGFLALDGKTKCFDKNGDGHVRSDSINVLFLQKAKDAKRIYSEVYYAKCSYSPSSKQLLPVREPKELAQFLETFYSEIDVSPHDVDYVEANGAAFAEADANELTAIGRVFGKQHPIKVGCVKSNMGSSEPASGVCGTMKVCLAFQHGKLPGNLHYKDPLDIPEVKDGKIQILTDTTEFNGRFAALNSFSNGGANVHVLLKKRYKEKDNSCYKSSIPHLILLSGRNEDCIAPIMDNLKQRPIDPEEVGLLHSIHQFDIPGHMSRGYTILEKNAENKTICLSQSVEYCTGTTRPLWFVYSGMGSQWTAMGAELMRIPVFAAAIQKCHNVLEMKGIDIVRILTEPDKTIYDNILHSFVGIAAVQIGLTDLLTDMGIVPDNIIGHSVGELGCAYADGCFTAEEMILSAYSRGLVSVQTPFIRGSMAAVGLGYKAILPLCPPGIEVACHNSTESATISGPADIMKEFVADLISQGIFAKEVPCSNIAYHSKYIADAGPALLEYLSEVIQEPKARSNKWVSTSVPEDNWDEPSAQYSSAKYHTNNLLKPVLFEEASKLIPADAVVIEIAPHGLLQAILKKSLSECLHVPLTRRGTSDPVKFLLEAVGKLYQAGLNPKVDILYPKIIYPVSTGTPLLSQHVGWEHSENWPQAKYSNKDRRQTLIRSFVMSLHDDDFSFLKGHVRKGHYVFPEAAVLQLVWENLAMHQGVNFRELSVNFKQVHFHNEAIMKYDEQLRLKVMINKGSRRFEVTNEESIIVTGFISELNDADCHQHETEEDNDSDQIKLTTNDIYTMMRLKGYSYEGDFQSIDSTNLMKTKATIKWNDNWTCFLDSIFQFNAFEKNIDKVLIPSHINKLTIHVDKHNALTLVGNNMTSINAYLNGVQERSKCGGVNVVGLVFKESKLLEHSQNILLNQQFVPHFLTGLIELKTALQINLQLVADNINKDIKVINLLSKESAAIKDLINECSGKIPFVNFTIESKTEKDLFADKTDLIILDNFLGDNKKMNNIHKTILGGAFILTIEKDTAKIAPKYKLFDIITTMSVGKQSVILLRNVNYSVEDKICFLPITLDKNFSWISKVQAELGTSQDVVLICERQPVCGLLGMVKKLRQEHGNRIRLIIVDDYHVPAFNLDKHIYRDQLQKNLAFNVLKKGQWGSYYYILSDSSKSITSQNVRLRSVISADVESLTWVEEPVDPLSNMQVQVCYTGPSLRDAQNAASKSHCNGYYGMDFSGIAKSGDRVMGLISKGAISSTVDADPDLLWPVPEHWTLEDAATVPLPYILAYYCLSRANSLSYLKDVFIQGGAGALGQAFIGICLSRGYTVHASVGDNLKKRFLLKLFPDLEEKNIVFSTDSCFQDTVKYNAKSGCCIVINCASGAKRQAALQLAGYEGVFIDLSDQDMFKDEEFQMGFLYFSCHYVSIKLDSIFKPEFSMDKEKLKLLLSDGVATGVVRPLSRVVYSPADVGRAFRLLAASKQRGKVLLRMEHSQAAGEHLTVAKRMSYSSTGPYIVVIDDNIVLGMELADTLIKHGATKTVLCLKPNQLAGFCYTKFSRWKDLNVTIKLSTENLQTEKGCVNLLQEATKLGPILGIFMVQNFSGPETLEAGNVVAKFNNTAGVVANLDLTSRKICNDLNHFVVVIHSKSDGGASAEYVASAIDSICDSRKDACLPALSFHISSVKELDHGNPEKSGSNLKTILSDLETSLRLKHTVAASVHLNKNDVLTLQKFSNIIGIDIKDIDIDKIYENLSIESFLQHDVSIAEVCSVINKTYDISYSVEEILKLSIADLKNLENTKSRDKPKLKDGLDAFFSYIDADECKAAEPGVFMATACSCVQDEEELNPKETYLMLMPGFEGHHEVFTTLCERLKVQAVAFQYGPEHTNATVPETASLILKFIKKRFELKTKFYLLGYSFGVNVALEVARLIENEGHVGVVFCVDGSPSFVRAALGAHLATVDGVGAVQDRLAAHMYSLMRGGEASKLARSLAALPNWEDKVNACVNKLRGVANLSNQYKRCILQGTYNRIMVAGRYEPAFRLRSELVLIKGVPHPNMVPLPHDYGLSQYSAEPVQVFQVNADHASIPCDCKVTSIVNRLLDPNIIKAFKNKNVCETYVLKPLKGW